MAFIDYEYYFGEYKGSPIPSEEFTQYAERACDIIDGLTDSRALSTVKKGGKAAVSVKKAACAQTEMLHAMAGQAYLGMTGGEISREEIGSAAVSYRKKDGISYLGIPISGLAVMYLSEARLMQRSI